MRVVRLLGVGDILAALAILLAGSLPVTVVRLFALYLVMKGGVFTFLGDRMSLLDAVCGLYLLAASNGISFTLISVAAAIYLVQKAVLSFA